MQWRDELLARLEALVPAGYAARGEAASEPTALAGLALEAAGNSPAAAGAADWLVEHQSDDGSVGVTSTQANPCWPTSLAILLWQRLADHPQFRTPVSRAVQWALDHHGETTAQQPGVAHDTTLTGWSWADHTHSWLEPTALFVLALQATDRQEHPRTREGVRLLVDRLLPHGGCNYGNTLVLGQELLPHVQPTGIVMMALAGEEISDPRLQRSLEFLEHELSAETTTASLCYGLLGLAAHGRSPVERLDWLKTAYERPGRQAPSPHLLALIALASGNEYPFRV